MATKAKREMFFAAVLILCFGAFAEAQIVINGSPDANNLNLYAWYKADAISASDSDVVISWKDQSSKGRDLTNTVGGGPSFIANGLNSRAVLRFNGSQGLWAANGAWGTIAQPNTIFIVGLVNNAAVHGYFIDSSNSSGREVFSNGAGGATAGSWNMYAGTTFLTSAVQASMPQIHSLIFNGSNSAHYINGEPKGSGNAGTESMYGICVGCRYSFNNFLQGDIAEILIYDRILSETELNEVQTYLKGKWLTGLTVRSSSEPLSVTETGQSDSYDMCILGQPAGNVNVTVTPDMQLDVGAGAAAAITLTYIPGQVTVQTVTVNAVDDIISEGPHTGKINYTVQSTDPLYNGFAISDTVVNIADNEPFCGQPGTKYLEADLNRDCYVNLLDLLQLVVDWLECSDPSNDTCNYGSLPLAPVWSDIFAAGENGINTYRIPSIVTALDGTLLAFCEARKVSSGDKSPTKMVLKRSFDDGKSWAAMQVLHDVGNDATMDPTAIVDHETGKIWLLYELYPYGWNSNVVAGLTYPSCTVWVTSSADNGATWSQPKDITAQVKMPDWTYYSIGPGVGIQTLVGTDTGRMILPCHHGAGTVDPKHIFYSDDHGASWQIGAGFIPAGNESQMVELIDGTYYMNIRDGGAAGRKISHSYDEGASWSPIINDPVLIEPSGCQASAIRYTRTDDGYSKNRILFSNPASVSSRVNMTVRLSYDEGKTWAASKSIYAGPSAYSCLTILRDGSVGLMWESGKSGAYEKITFVRFNLAWLTDGQDYLPGK